MMMIEGGDIPEPSGSIKLNKAVTMAMEQLGQLKMDELGELPVVGHCEVA